MAGGFPDAERPGGVPIRPGTSTAPARPPPPDDFDLFGSSPVVDLVQSVDRPFPPGNYEVTEPGGRFLGRLRREGTGWESLQMRFALDNPEGHAVYRIRPGLSPPTGVGRRASRLEDPFGTTIGELRWTFPQVGTLRLLSGPTYRAKVSGFGGWFGFESAGRTLARAIHRGGRYGSGPFVPPSLHVEFEPLGPDRTDRSRVVVLASWVALIAPPGRHLGP